MYVSPLRQKAFPFGEGVGFADGRGYCLPFRGRCQLSRRKRTLPSPFGEGVGSADGRGYCLPLLGKVSALLTEEDIAFPFGEDVGIADGRGLCDRKCPPSAELNGFKNKKSSRPMQNMA